MRRVAVQADLREFGEPPRFDRVRNQASALVGESRILCSKFLQPNNAPFSGAGRQVVFPSTDT